MTNWLILALLVVILLLIVVIAYIIFVNQRERAALLDRIMARDFTEFSVIAGKKPIGRAGNYMKQRIDKIREEQSRNDGQ